MWTMIARGVPAGVWVKWVWGDATATAFSVAASEGDAHEGSGRSPRMFKGPAVRPLSRALQSEMAAAISGSCTYWSVPSAFRSCHQV
jgi:hypothetical protein